MKHMQTATLNDFNLGSLTLRPFAGEGLMVVRVEAPRHSIASAHAHPHEQMTLVISGRLRFRIDDEECELGPGEILHIPSNAKHEAEALEESLFFDIFHPIPEDFLARVEDSR